MLGAIIGDIVGSVYEFHNIKTKEFPFFQDRMFFTDDSVLTFATADWILNGGKIERIYVRYATEYPHRGYGGSFKQWITDANRTGDYAPYNSCGNGSAMRVSPVGWAFNKEEEVLDWAKKSAECTHNHPEGIKGAQTTALCIFLARNGASKETIKSAVEKFSGYDLSMSVEELNRRYSWNGIDEKGNGELCQESVPQAIICALQAVDFEDAIRNAISIGGDSDTIACITGGIAEALYGIPENIYSQGISYLPDGFKSLLLSFESKFGCNKISDCIADTDKMNTFTPNRIDKLHPHEVFVFGSNLQGMHGGGAARVAYKKFGAVWGKGVGLYGQSYAIPTMQGGVNTIKPYVDDFISFAKSHPELVFYVTRIGCGIAGFKDKEIAPLFKDALKIENIILPEKFVACITSEEIFQLPDFLKTKIYGQTRTLVDMLIELNKKNHYTSVETALKELFSYLENTRIHGDEVAFTCSIRNLNNSARKWFENGKLNIQKLEDSLHTDFYKGIELVYENYVIEKAIKLISYLNDFRRYSNSQQLIDDFMEVTKGVNHCGENTTDYYSFSSEYVNYFFCNYITKFCNEFTHNGTLDNNALYNFMIGRHERGIKKYGLDAVINHNYQIDCPCHPEVYVPYKGGAGPVYVAKAFYTDETLSNSKRRFVKSCGNGKGPDSIPDLFEFKHILPLLGKDKKYILYSDYYIPKNDDTLPVFNKWSGRVLFDNNQAQKEFIHNMWEKVRSNISL